jgi:hypothetical protein
MVVSVTDEAILEVVETIGPIEVGGMEADESEADADEIAGERDEPLASSSGPDITGDAPPTPAHARLGAEGVLRLRARHAEVLARISERIADPVRREELKLQAERLNPDTWVTDAEVAVGIEQYETVFEALRSVVGRRRKRRRRKGPRPPAAPAAAGAAPPADPDRAEIGESGEIGEINDEDGPDSPAADDSDEG